MSGANQTPTGGNPAGTSSFNYQSALRPIASKLQEAGLGMPQASTRPGQTGARPAPGAANLSPTGGQSTQPLSGGTGGMSEADLMRLLAQLGRR